MPLDASRLGGVLFDLDGTFADTARDLAFALNATLRHYGRQPLPFEVIRPVVSHGGNALIGLGFGIGPEAPGFAARRSVLLEIYEHNLARETRIFPGLERVLAHLERRCLPWGIVTNKPAWLTEPLMSALNMASRAATIVSGDSCGNRKPHPEPVLCACRQMGLEPTRCVYVGDAARDIEAGRAAGTATIAAVYGYLLPEDDPAGWAADALAERPEDLIRLLAL